MRAYAVYFDGYWPIGAVAVVRANNSDEAKKELLKSLPPDLQIKNSFSTLSTDRLRRKVTILLDGNY